MEQITKKAVQETITNRTDSWWALPLLMLVAGVSAVLYLGFAAFSGAHYAFPPYVSPVYAAPFIPVWWKLSPAFLLLWVPLGFRLTCYYSRKTYYQAALLDPAACAVSEPYRKGYSGETQFPFILQNFHRYFLYLALILLGLHWYELCTSIVHEGRVYLGVGTLILFLDTLALTLYVFSCHSLRHLVGVKRGFSSCCKDKDAKKIRYALWKKISVLNTFHNGWFWISLFSIVVADAYIRLLSLGIIPFDAHVVF